VVVRPQRQDLPALDAAAARVGDRWTLLVVARLLDGACRFGELQTSLPGLAPNILTRRLRMLEQEGLVVAEPYSRRPVRVAYRLTDRGAALADALRLLTQWGAEHPAPGGGPAPLQHQACGTRVEARWWCPTCATTVADGDTSDLTWV
jgi:DNA-binding HxlR family transcriptional regulator